METLLIFMLATIGMTNIVCHGKIMDVIGIRPFLKRKLSDTIFDATQCYECMGFWCGMIVAAMVVTHNPFMIFCLGCAGSLIAQFYNNLIYFIDSKTEFVMEDDLE